MFAAASPSTAMDAVSALPRKAAMVIEPTKAWVLAMWRSPKAPPAPFLRLKYWASVIPQPFWLSPFGIPVTCDSAPDESSNLKRL